MENVLSSLRKLKDDNNLGPDPSLQDLSWDLKAAQDLGVDLGQGLPVEIKFLWLKLQQLQESGSVIFAVMKTNTFAIVVSLVMMPDL